MIPLPPEEWMIRHHIVEVRLVRVPPGAWGAMAWRDGHPGAITAEGATVEAAEAALVRRVEGVS